MYRHGDITSFQPNTGLAECRRGSARRRSDGYARAGMAPGRLAAQPGCRARRPP